MAGVSIRGLTKRYGGHPVVADLELDIGDGEFVTLLGPSGCGKTTTLRCLAGLERPDEGVISIGERVVSADGGRVFVPPDKRDAGMVFQSYALWPHMTVFGNVAYPLRVRRVGRAQVRARVTEALEAVGLDHLARRSVSAISGGQQQRVALARALVARPNLLLFDEPLSNLDARLRASMRAELRALHRRVGTTSVYVTHDQIEALTLSDRIVVMDHGVIQQVGTPEEIYATPANAFVAGFVGFDNFLPGTVTAAGGVAVPGFASAACDAPGRTEGDEVVLAVRANGVTIAPGLAEPPARSARGRVVDRVYLGDQIEYSVRAADHTLKVRTGLLGGNGAAPHAAGDDVIVTLPPGNVTVLEPPAHQAP